MFTAITISAPIFFAVLTGMFSTSPPSTRVRSFHLTGERKKVTLELALIALASEPLSRITGLPETRSVQTALNFIKRSSKLSLT